MEHILEDYQKDFNINEKKKLRGIEITSLKNVDISLKGCDISVNKFFQIMKFS